MDINDFDQRKQSLQQGAEQIRREWHDDADLFNDGQPLTLRELGMLSSIRQSSKNIPEDTEKFMQSLIVSKYRQDTDIADAWANLDVYSKELTGKPAEYTKTRTQSLKDLYTIAKLRQQRDQLSIDWMNYDQKDDEDELVEVETDDPTHNTAGQTQTFKKGNESARVKKADIASKIKALDDQMAALHEHIPADTLTEILGWFPSNAPLMIDLAKEGGKVGALSAIGVTVMALMAGFPITAPLALGTTLSLAGTGATIGGAAFTVGSIAGAMTAQKEAAKGAMYYDLRSQGVEKPIAYWASEANGWIQAIIEQGLGVMPVAGKTLMKGAGIERIAYKTAIRMFASGRLGALAKGLYKMAKTGAGEGSEEFLQGEADYLTKVIVSVLSESGYEPDQTAVEAFQQSCYEALAGATVGFVMGIPVNALQTHMDMKYAESLVKDAETTPTKEEFIENHRYSSEFLDAFGELPKKEQEDILGKVYDRNQTEVRKRELNERKQRDTERNNRRDALNKEKEELQGREETEYNKQRLEAIDKELADLDSKEKEDNISDARKTTERARENYFANPDEKTKQSLDNATEEQRQKEKTLSDTERRYNETVETDLGRDMTEEEVDNLVELDQNVQAERTRTTSTEEEQDWQKTPEEVKQEAESVKETSQEEGNRVYDDIKKSKEGKAVRRMTQKADYNTWLRQAGHIIRGHINADMLNTLAKHYNIKDGNWTVSAEDRLTEDLDTFLKTGQTPASELRGAFNAATDTLLNIYNDSVAVSDDIDINLREIAKDTRSVLNGRIAPEDIRMTTVKAGEKPKRGFNFRNPVELDADTVRMGGGIEQAVKTFKDYVSPEGTMYDGIIIKDGGNRTYVALKDEKKGKVLLDFDIDNINQMQKDSIETIGNVVSGITHNNVFVYESVEKDGQRVFAKDVGGHKAGTPAPNGFYDPATSSIYIDLNAGNNGEGVMLWTASHELTHFVKQWSPEKFKTLADFLQEEYGKKGVDMETLVQRQIDKAKRAGRDISYETAYEEVVADSMQTMFTDTNLAEKLEKLRLKDQSLWERIKAFIIDLYNRIMDEYRNFDPQTEEAKIVRSMGDVLDSISDKFANALVDAGLNFEEEGVYVADDAIVKDSLRTWNETDKEKLLQKLIKSGKTEKEAKKWIKDVNGVAAWIAYDPTRLDYESDDLFSMKKTDSEYYITIDASTLCPKRRYYQGTYDAIMEVRPNYQFTEDDMIWLRQKLMDNGHEAFCSFCYVESRRKLLYKFAAQFKKDYKGKYKPSMYELTSDKGNLKLRQEHPEVFKAFVDAMAKKGSNSPKVIQPRTSYKREILKITPAMVKKLNHIGGLRWQSYSDLDIVNIIDVMQSILDATTLKDKQGNPLNGQAYTKVPAFAAIFGSTNLKINVSVVAYVDEKGNLVFDNIEGMDIKEAKRLRKMYPDTVGSILVGSDERQIRAAMASDVVDFIIPFHASGWSADNAKALGLKGYLDHTALQHDVKADYTKLEASRKKAGGNYFPDDYWDYSIDGNANAMKYLNMCLDDGRLPRFLNYAFERDAAEAFVKANPDIMVKIPSATKPVPLTADLLLSVEGMKALYNPSNSRRDQRAIAYNYLKFALENGYQTTNGYWKTLIDFRMYNDKGVGVPQQGLVPKFNLKEAKKYMDAYEGGVDTLPVDEQAKNDFLEYIKDRPDLKYSLRKETNNQEISLSNIEDENLEDKNPTVSADVVESLSPLGEGKTATIYSKELKDNVLYEIGKAGKNGHGLLHIVEGRMVKDGKSLEEAIDIAIAVAESVADGEVGNSIENTRHLEKNGIRAIVAINKDNKKVISGFIIDKEDVSSATNQRTETYAPAPYVRSEQVVASLNERLSQINNYVNRNKSHIDLVYSQRTYHGSGADFDKFDTNFMGTGEGAQAFGWGVYLTQSEGIARGYADRMGHKSKDLTFYEKGEKITDLDKQGLLRGTSIKYGKTTAELKDGIRTEIREKEQKIAEHKERIERDKDILDTIKDRPSLSGKKLIELYGGDPYVNEVVKDAKEWSRTSRQDFSMDIVRKMLESDIDRQEWHIRFNESRIRDYKNIDLESLEVKNESRSSRNLYTVAIPDDTGNNYLYWDKIIDKKNTDKIRESLYKYMIANGKEGFSDEENLEKELKINIPTKPDKDWSTGESIYKTLTTYLEDSDKAASEFLSSMGYVGIDYPANSLSGGNKYGKRNFVIFNADDITINNHIQYSLRDREYAEAVNSGDMAKAQAMVDQRAREMGYNSPKLYHGTPKFGFTTIDVGESDDKMSFFATTEEETANTYTYGSKVKPISEAMSEEEYEAQLSQADDALDDAVRDFKRLIDHTFGEWYLGMDGVSYIKDEIENADIDTIYEKLTEIAYGGFDYRLEDIKRDKDAYSYNEEAIKYTDYNEWEENSSEFEKIAEAIADIENARTRLDNIVSKDNLTGIYALYAKTDNLLEVNGNKANWNEIQLDNEILKELMPHEGYIFEKYSNPNEKIDTRDLSKLAKELGYSGVHIKDIYDNGGRTRTSLTKPADVYIFFNPQSQVKSADPVTYDDNGQIIPLSQRFNPEHTEQNLLYSDREQTYEEATEQGNYVPDDILNQYRGQAWADEEIKTRADLRSDAQDYETYEQFLPSMVRIDPTKTDQYYFEIWQTRQDDAFVYEDILPSLSKRMLEKVLSTIRKVMRSSGNKPEGLLGEYLDKKKLTDSEYKTMMAEIKSAPDKYIALITDCFQTPEEFDLMMSSLYRHPDYAIKVLDKEAKLLKTDKKRANLTISKLNAKIADIKQKLKDTRVRFNEKLADKREKIEETRNTYKGKLADQKVYYQNMLAELKQAYKDRAEFNRYVRIIMKKPPKMCAVEYAKQIIAEQAKLSTSTMMDTTRERLQRQYEKTTNPRLRAKIKQDLERKSLKEMSLEEVANKAKEIATLRREGVLKRMEEILANRERNLEQIAKLKKPLGEVKPIDKTGSVESKEDSGHIYEKLLGFWADMHRITEYIGKEWVEWFGIIRNAFLDEERNVSRRRDACLDHMKKLGITPDTLSKKEVIKGKQFATDPELGNTYTHDVLMSWYIYGQNEDSLAALVYGNFRANGEDQDSVQRVLNTLNEGVSRLSPEEKALADWMIESFDGEDWNRIATTTRNVYNLAPEKIPRYFMMIRQLDGTTDAQADPAIDLGERTPNARRASIKRGFTKERLHNIRWDHQKPIQLGALPIYMKAIRQQEHYIAFAQLAKDMRYVYGNVKDDLASKYGAEFASDIEQNLNRIIDPSAYDSFYTNMGRLGKLVSNTVVASLSWNVLSWLKQFPSVAYFLPYCDGGSLINSWYHYATNWKQITDDSFAKSPALKNRKIDDAISMTQEMLMNPNVRFRQLKKITKAGMTPFGWFDEFACVIGWNAVYTFQKEHGATEAEAVDKANVALLKTQPQAYAQFSPLAYTRPFLRTALLFSRQANQINQMIASDLVNTVRSDAEFSEKFKFFYRTIFSVALGSLIMGWAGRKFAGYGGDDDDDKSWYTDALQDIAANTVHNIPFLGSEIANLIQRKTYTSGGYSDPVSQFTTAMTRFLNKPVKKDELNYDGAMRAFTEVMRINGLPSVATWRAYKAIVEQDPMYLIIGSPLGGKKEKKKTYYKKK